MTFGAAFLKLFGAKLPDVRALMAVLARFRRQSRPTVNSRIYPNHPFCFGVFSQMALSTLKLQMFAVNSKACIYVMIEFLNVLPFAFVMTRNTLTERRKFFHLMAAEPMDVFVTRSTL
jgi:hypothetical protein